MTAKETSTAVTCPAVFACYVILVDLLRNEFTQQQRTDRTRDAIVEHVILSHVSCTEHFPGYQYHLRVYSFVHFNNEQGRKG
jgi:hypothetical protein